MKSSGLGFFGNIWVKQNVLELAGEAHDGHAHPFDHVTLLTAGRVSIKVEGKQPKEFSAPQFVIIRKNQEHQITALENSTVYYCLHAMRDLDGEVIELFDESNDPLASPAE